MSSGNKTSFMNSMPMHSVDIFLFIYPTLFIIHNRILINTGNTTFNYLFLFSCRRGAGSAEKGTLLVLGDVNSGKSALLARARGEQIPPLKHGVALTYDFMNVYEDNTEEPIGDIDVWVLEVKLSH
jgi:hypothetical protein